MRRGAFGVLTAALAVLVIVPAAAAKADGKRGQSGGSARLVSFPSCESLVAFGDGQARARIRGYPPTYIPPYPDPNAVGVTGTASEATGAAGKSFSTTNVQERGVDEPDSVKTDGSTIFVLRGDSLHAIDGRAQRPTLLGSLPLSGFDHTMLLNGSRMLVISRNYQIPESIVPPPHPDGPPPRWATSWEESHPWADYVTVLSEIDVSDPGHMSVLRTQEVDGDYLDARQVGDQIRVIVSTTPAATIAPASSLRSAVAGWVPYSRFTDLTTGESTVGPGLDSCGEIGRPSKFSGLDMLSVLTIDLSRGLPAVDADGVMSSGRVAYASRDGLYVATERWHRRATRRNPGHAATALHKFDISRPDESSYAASGFVRGNIRDQFSLSEDQGLLRVVSSAPEGGENPRRETLLSVLRADGDQLKLIGHVADIGRGEDVQAVRMIGDAGYVVTFRQIDPLFTVDLSNPRRPRLAGKLEIPGFSAYLHPISDRLLLGVGSEADSQGVVHGSQVSLFDVSNLAHPDLVAKRVVNASTSVGINHHAFLYWPRTKQAIIPFKRAAWSRRHRFAGALSFSIGQDAIVPTGKIVQPKGRGNAVQRSLVIGDRLFTVSCRSVQADALSNLSTVGVMTFPDPRACRYRY